MNENNRNYLAWCEEMRRREDVAYGLRFALFVISTVAVAAVVWLGLCHAAPVVLRFEAREQERLQAEYEGLQAEYDAEMVEGELRAARLRDNGEPVAAAAWRIASEAPAIRKGDAE